MVRAGGAVLVVVVACGPDQDGFLGRIGLCHRGDRVAEGGAQVRLRIVVDDPPVPEAQVGDVNAAGMERVRDVLEFAVRAGEADKRDRAVRLVAARERNREHLEVGARGDTAEAVVAQLRGQAQEVGADDARHGGAV